MGVKLIVLISLFFVLISCEKSVQYNYVEYYATSDSANFEFKFINSEGDWESRNIMHNTVQTYRIKMVSNQKMGMEIIAADSADKVNGWMRVDGDSINNYIFEDVRYSVVGDSLQADSIINYIKIESIIN